MSHTVSPTSGATYTASFKTQYLLTMSAGAGGAVSPAKQLLRRQPKFMDQCDCERWATALPAGPAAVRDLTAG